jgi:hypothetical protein
MSSIPLPSVPSVPEQPVDFFQRLVEDLATEEGHDYAVNLLWKDEEEFQEVLNYWSSRFRAIHMAKLAQPIETEFQSSWQKYYGAEVVSFLFWPGAV